MLDRSGRDYSIKISHHYVRKSCVCKQCGHMMSNHDITWSNGIIKTYSSPSCAAEAYDEWWNDVRQAETERIARRP